MVGLSRVVFGPPASSTPEMAARVPYDEGFMKTIGFPLIFGRLFSAHISAGFLR